MNDPFPHPYSKHQWQDSDSAVVRFAGDSGDGIQLIGGQFVRAFAAEGNDYASFPDFPAEIRAPAGTTYGVSAFQIHFGERKIHTIGDAVDVLIAFNPAALKVNLGDLIKGGLIIADASQFSERNLRKANFTANPLEDGSLQEYNVLAVDITAMASEAVSEFGLGNKDSARSKNMWALGLALWLFKRSPAPIETWLKSKFANDENIANANISAIKAGLHFGDISEVPLPENRATKGFAKVPFAKGHYRNITGTQALSLGLLAAVVQSQVPMLFSSYPITPASALLHEMTKYAEHGVRTFQAEDEIAAATAAIGASYSGALGVTSSSGPGIALKGEAIGLAAMAELPLVVINTQRGGPSTGLPTKTEQADLLQAIAGRNGDNRLPVIAADSPGGNFSAAFTAAKIAMEYMTPVFLLSDGFLANSSEVWQLPQVKDLPAINPPFVKTVKESEPFYPYAHDPKTYARPWAVPGQEGLTHRIGGIEKAENTGHVSYDPDNHQRMTDIRHGKLAKIADILPPQTVTLGADKGKLAVIGWGSTFGPIHRAVDNAIAAGQSVSHIHITHLSPLPLNLSVLLSGFDDILVVEMNMGQLQMVLQSHLGAKLEALHRVTGRPVKVADIAARINEILSMKS